MSFTGSKDVDILILLELSNEDLENFGKANKYIELLYKNDVFWFRKLVKIFDKLERDNIPIDWKTVDILNQMFLFLEFDTWKEFYNWYIHREYQYGMGNSIRVMKEEIGEIPLKIIEEIEGIEGIEGINIGNWRLNKIMNKMSKGKIPKWINIENFKKEVKRELFIIWSLVSDSVNIINFDIENEIRNSIFNQFTFEE